MTSSPVNLPEHLIKKLKELPHSPGCYIFKGYAKAPTKRIALRYPEQYSEDKNKRARKPRIEVIYVGKAVNLYNRVRQYFYSSGDTRAFIPLLGELLTDIEVVLTNTEKEALILENTLIKKHQPRFNINLKDDKNFILLRIDNKHPFPRVEITRKLSDDGAAYFGPYSRAGKVRETLRLINRFFTIRKCSDQEFARRKRPCLQYQIKRCPGPCTYQVDTRDYTDSISEVQYFLKGDQKPLVNRLLKRMNAASNNEEFERAAHFRDQIQAVKESLEKQRVSFSRLTEQDIVAMHREGSQAALTVMIIRRGQLIDTRHFFFSEMEIPDDALIENFLQQYYDGNRTIPMEVVLSHSPVNPDTLRSWIHDLAGKPVELTLPSRGEKKKLLALAMKNAQQHFKEQLSDKLKREKILKNLQRRLKLRWLPQRIECFDISNFQGRLAVGSMVVFENGRPAKARYRKYKIKTLEGPNDFGMMLEVLSRRYKRALKENDLPDCIMVDGGRGQLGIAVKVLRELGIFDPDVISLAKSRVIRHDNEDERQPELPATNLSLPANGPTNRSPRGSANNSTNSPLGKDHQKESKRTPERVFLPGRVNPVVLRQNSDEIFLLQRVRDESHRFAIDFHRELRRKAQTQSILDDIPGVGSKRKKQLLNHFGSLKRIKKASIKDLAKIDGITEKLAQRIRNVLDTTTT